MTPTRRDWSRDGRRLSFTELGFGTAPLGNLDRAIPEADADAAMQAAWDAGVRHFDTAPLYGLGLAETRLNRFLRDKPRDDYVLSTKVGRYLVRGAPAARWVETPRRAEVFDYGHDGVLRALDASFERLGVDRVDILYVHDIDVPNQGSRAAVDARVEELMAGGYRALDRLRAEGAVAAIGAGVNEWEVCETLLARGDWDLFLLAGRYTLLDQGALDSFLPLCEGRGVGIVTGGPYNSGILATGAAKGARYDYADAPPEVLDRARAIARVCAAHDTDLRAAALRFPLLHPAHVSVIPGCTDAAQVAQAVDAIRAEVPPALWSDLKANGLIRADAPTG